MQPLCRLKIDNLSGRHLAFQSIKPGCAAGQSLQLCAQLRRDIWQLVGQDRVFAGRGPNSEQSLLGLLKLRGIKTQALQDNVNFLLALRKHVQGPIQSRHGRIQLAVQMLGGLRKPPAGIVDLPFGTLW